MELNRDNYFSKESNQEYMSVSQFKSLVPQLGGCEAAGMAKIRGEWEFEPSISMLQGSYVHAWQEGRLDDFIADHPEIQLKAGGLKAEFRKADEAIDFISKDHLFMTAISGRKEVVFTGELFGIKWKILVDSYFPEEKRFTDLKYLKSLDEKFWNRELQIYENIFDKYGYLIQMAIYCKIIEFNTLELFQPFLAVVTKEAIPDKAIVSFVSDQESVEDFVAGQLSLVSLYIDRVKQVKSGEVGPIRCEKCDYCKTTKKLTGTIHYTKFDL